MEITITIGAQLIIALEELKANPTLFKTTQQLFTYKNPKFLENEKWGYSNHAVSKYLYSYQILNKKMYISRGGLPKLLEHWKKFKVTGRLIDRTFVTEPIDFEQSNTIARPDQIKFMDELLQHDFGCGQAFTSFGKCHIKGTKVVMYEGYLKNVENVREGDLLMGPDSKPRKVLKTCVGFGKLYQIIPHRGDSFVVNDEHKLPLKVTGNSRWRDRSTKWAKDSVHVVSVKDYLNYSKGKKHILKLWRNGCEFGAKNLPYDPYYIGLWLGDGSKTGTTISNNEEPEIVDFLYQYADFLNLRIRVERVENKCTKYHLIGHKPGGLRTYTKTNLLKDNQKVIPDDYLFSSTSQRRFLLAGLLDADGHLIKTDNKTFEITVKDNALAKQVLFLARSLGLSARNKVTPSSYRKKGVKFNVGEHNRITISGDTHLIPTLLKRKKASSHKTRTNALNSGFVVEPFGEGEYFGFELSDDHLYLTEDFTVHHNTVTAGEIIRRLRQRTLVLVHTTFLQKQWIDELTNPKLFNLDTSRIGGVGGCFKKRILGDINIGLYHSVMKENHLKFFEPNIGCLIFDEGQKTPIEGVQKASNNFRGRYRFALSARFKRKDGKEFLTFDTFGPIRTIAVETATDSKVLVKSIGLVPSNYQDEDQYGKSYTEIISEIARDRNRNIFICKRLIQQVRKKKLCMVFVERKEQAGILYKMLSKNFRVGMLVGTVNKKKIKENEHLPQSVKQVLYDYDDKKAYETINELAYYKNIDIIITTQKGEVGLSIRPLDYGLITTPMGNNLERFNQVKGRFERTYSSEQEKYFGKKKEPATLEVMNDYNIRSFRNAADNLKQTYGSIVKSVTKKKSVIRRRKT